MPLCISRLDHSATKWTAMRSEECSGAGGTPGSAFFTRAQPTTTSCGPQPPPPPFWVSCTCNTPILPRFGTSSKRVKTSHLFLAILLYLMDWRPSLYSGEFVTNLTEKYLPHIYLWAVSFLFQSNFQVRTSGNCLNATVAREGHWTLCLPLFVISVGDG